MQEQAPESTGSNNTNTIKSAGGGESGIALPGRDSIQIIADDVRNALVLMATPRDYLMVAEAIRKLDVAPLQVLIEASILE